MSSDEGVHEFHSVDGVTFKESKVALSHDVAGVTLGRFRVLKQRKVYRAYFANQSKDDDGKTWSRILSASSADLTDWKMDDGIRVGLKVFSFTGNASSPYPLKRNLDCVSLFYRRTNTGDSDKKPGIYYSTSLNGLSFSSHRRVDLPDSADDPYAVQTVGDNYLLYYTATDSKHGTHIRAATLALKSTL